MRWIGTTSSPAATAAASSARDGSTRRVRATLALHAILRDRREVDDRVDPVPGDAELERHLDVAVPDDEVDERGHWRRGTAGTGLTLPTRALLPDKPTLALSQVKRHHHILATCTASGGGEHAPERLRAIQSFRAGRDLAQLQQLETERFDLAEHAEYCRSIGERARRECHARAGRSAAVAHGAPAGRGDTLPVLDRLVNSNTPTL